MGIEDVHAVRYECDGCRRAVIADEVPENWFIGEVIQHRPSGGYGGDWVACRLACIKDAIKRVVEDDG
jgi:hypothetical protein